MRLSRSVMLAAVVSSQVILAGCAVTVPPTAGVVNRDATAAPMRDATIVFWFGNGTPQCAQQSAAYVSRFRSAMATRLPAIFSANGIRVAQTLVETKPVKYQRTQNGELALPPLGEIKTAHVIVLIADTVAHQKGCAPETTVSVNFDARVWDVQKNRQIWSGEPALLLVAAQPLLRSQQFAAALLNGFHKAGIIELKGGVAVDLNGQPLALTPAWEDDK